MHEMGTKSTIIEIMPQSHKYTKLNLGSQNMFLEAGTVSALDKGCVNRCLRRQTLRPSMKVNAFTGGYIAYL